MQDFWSLTRSGTGTVSAAGVPRPPEVNSNGDTLVAQGLPERSMLVAQGKSWEGGLSTTCGTISAITSGMPTTQTQLALYNGGTNNVLIDRFSIMVITSSTAGGIGLITTGVIGALQTGGLGAAGALTFSGTAVPALNIRSLSGKGTYGGNVRIYSNGTITAVPAIAITDWQPLQSLPGAGAAATTLGSVVVGECFGRYIVPPGACIGFNVMGASAAGTNGAWITFHETSLLLG